MKLDVCLRRRIIPGLYKFYSSSNVMSQLADPFASSGKEKGTLVIYGQSTSRVCKVLWAAAEADVKVERVELPLAQLKEQKWYYDINPKLTVPCMRDGDLVINESNSICSYICQVYGKHLYPSSPDLLALAWQWLEYGETTIAATQTPIWFGVTKNIKYSTKTSPADKDEINLNVPKCVKAWKAFDEHMAKDNRLYVLGNSFTMADFTLAVQADRLKKSDGCGFEELKMKRFPHVDRWLKTLESRDSFQKILGT